MPKRSGSKQNEKTMLGQQKPLYVGGTELEAHANLC